MSELKELMLADPALTLAVAESLTSGHLQARIGAVSGASAYFLGGVTAYSLEQKVNLLGVDRAEAARVNCVSARVAEQMARGVCVLFGARLGVATTGYAEPAPALGVTVPHAFWAVAWRQGASDYGVMSGRAEFPDLGRVDVQKAMTEAAHAALVGFLREPAARYTR
jgi:nicotinamide-nucleotide amidase